LDNVQSRFAISKQRLRYGFWHFIAENAHRVVGETHQSQKSVLRTGNFRQVIERLPTG
jgi:hypothetical protein